MAGKPDDAEPSTWGGETPAPAPLRSQNPGNARQIGHVFHIMPTLDEHRLDRIE